MTAPRPSGSPRTERHPRTAVHLPRLRRQPVDGDHLTLRDLRIAGDRDADDLRLAVAERDQLHAPQHLAVESVRGAHASRGLPSSYWRNGSAGATTRNFSRLVWIGRRTLRPPSSSSCNSKLLSTVSTWNYK